MKYYCAGSYISTNNKEDMEWNESFEYKGNIETIEHHKSATKILMLIVSIKKTLRKVIYKKEDK